MTDAQKLATVQTLIEDGSGYMPTPETLNTYISIAGSEILAWMYHLIGGVPEDVTEVPSKYEGIQIYAVVVGWTHAGAEGQGLSITDRTDPAPQKNEEGAKQEKQKENRKGKPADNDQRIFYYI